MSATATTEGGSPTASAAFPEVMTAEEAAAFLRLPANLLVRKAREGQIPGARIGRRWRFSRRLLLEWIEGASIPEDLVEKSMVEAVRERMAVQDEWLTVDQVRQRLGL